MFWFWLFACFLAIVLWLCSEDVAGFVALFIAFILLLVQLSIVPSKTLITTYEQTSLAYEAGKYDTYNELYSYKQTIDDYNEGLEASRKSFYVWPYASKKWKKCEKAEYPDDLHDKIVEALKKDDN